MIVVVGAGLAGLAAAARLARVGHQVVLYERTAAAGDGPAVSGEPDGEVITLPAAWRDVFRKTGRTLDAELGRLGLSLAPAPPRSHRLADGTRLDLPSDRAAQWVTLTDAFGPATAAAWRDLLDDLDGSWQVLRRLGLEAEFSGRLGSAERAALRPRQSIAGLAGQVPELAEVVLDVAARLGQDPSRLPGWHAARLAVERTFGRWRVVDAGGVPRPARLLAGLLAARAAERGVDVRTGVEVTAIHPDRASVRVATTAGEVAATAVVSSVDPFTHADLTRERPDLAIARRLQRSPAGGPRWTSWRTLLDLPRLQPARPAVLVASGWSPGGPDAWAQVLTGALAAYRLHEDLTGEDMRPTNKAYRPPAILRAR